MKIQTIETIVLRIPYTTGGSADADSWGGKAWQTADALLVKVRPTGGSPAGARRSATTSFPPPRPRSTDARADVHRAGIRCDRSLMLELQQKLHIFGRGGRSSSACPGIDIALWDIAGKAAGQPVHELLGGCRAAAAALLCQPDPLYRPEGGAANVAARWLRDFATSSCTRSKSLLLVPRARPPAKAWTSCST